MVLTSLRQMMRMLSHRSAQSSLESVKVIPKVHHKVTPTAYALLVCHSLFASIIFCVIIYLVYLGLGEYYILWYYFIIHICTVNPQIVRVRIVRVRTVTETSISAIFVSKKTFAKCKDTTVTRPKYFVIDNYTIRTNKLVRIHIFDTWSTFFNLESGNTPNFEFTVYY